jgi:hypothetical protein
MNQFEIGTVRGNEPGAVGSCGQGNQNVEMQVTQFVGCNAARGANPSQDLA